MRKSLYLKFIMGYVLFAVLSFITIAGFSSRLTYRICLNRQVETLQENAVRTAELCSSFYTGRPEVSDKLFSELDNLSAFLDYQIWILDSSGRIVYDSSGQKTDETIAGFDPADTTERYRTGDFYGSFPTKMLTVTAPITANFKTYGYTALHMPLSLVSSTSDHLLIPIYLTFVIIFLLSLIILLIFRFHVAAPLKEITAAAKEYAAGNLKYELSLKTEDEMGYLADTLNFMAHELSNSEDYQRQFIANVSHDFRSPLTSIRGYLEAIVDGTIPPENQEKYLNIVINETERLTGLTQNMLSLNSLDRKAPSSGVLGF